MSGSEVEKSKHVSKSRQKPKREEMPVQESKERIKNFKEVALGYTPEQAIAEAARCLGCKKSQGFGEYDSRRSVRYYRGSACSGS